MKFGSKKTIFEVIWGGLDLIWESATPPTHIWERFPNYKKGILQIQVGSTMGWGPDIFSVWSCIDTIEVILSEWRYTGGAEPNENMKKVVFAV